MSGWVRWLVIVAVVGLMGVGLYRWGLGRGESAGALVRLDSGQLVLMGTVGRIQLDCVDEATGRAALAAALAALREVDERLSTYREDSELAAVNRQAGEGAVAVSEETYRLLERAWLWSERTGGAFDVTVGPLLDLWREAAEVDVLPTKEVLAAARAKVGWGQLVLEPEGRTAAFGVAGMVLNVDGIAKGYAVDRAAEAAGQAGAAGGLVDIGGEVAVFGRAAGGQGWLIGVQDPFAADVDDQLSERVRWRIRLKAGAVATSGNYRRYRQIGGQRHSHIVDARTGQTADALASVTVVAATTETADVLATAVSVLGLEAGMALIEEIEGAEAFAVSGGPGEMAVHRSSGWEGEL